MTSLLDKELRRISPFDKGIFLVLAVKFLAGNHRLVRRVLFNNCFLYDLAFAKAFVSSGRIARHRIASRDK